MRSDAFIDFAISFSFSLIWFFDNERKIVYAVHGTVVLLNELVYIFFRCSLRLLVNVGHGILTGFSMGDQVEQEAYSK